jgi:hypothetical protein
MIQNSTPAPRAKNAESDIRHLRVELLTYCHDLPRLIREGGASHELGWMALTLGKCFVWIDGIFVRYDDPVWTMSRHRELTVKDIGQQLKAVGIEMLDKRGHESAIELQLAWLNLRMRSLEKMVLAQQGGAQ